MYTNPFHQMENPTALLSSLLQTTSSNNSTTQHHPTRKKSSKSGGGGGGVLRMFKLLPMLTTGCKMVALLGGRPRKPMLTDSATIVTIFGYRKGRLSLAVQEDPHRVPVFVIELPMQSTAFNKEMGSDIVRLALESETKTHKKKLLEEFVWGVYCNGRKYGYSIRRKNMSDEELHVMQLLRGVSMGAGVLPSSSSSSSSNDHHHHKENYNNNNNNNNNVINNNGDG